mmetsp:Transcript_49541/g.152912  ORF Transcript_49541/g.152912 Transcript_49541/m.152912 type:complete len:270 (-) Transcript_49541:980-1789(-)
MEEPCDDRRTDERLMLPDRASPLVVSDDRRDHAASDGGAPGSLLAPDFCDDGAPFVRRSSSTAPCAHGAKQDAPPAWLIGVAADGWNDARRLLASLRGTPQACVGVRFDALSARRARMAARPLATGRGDVPGPGPTGVPNSPGRSLTAFVGESYPDASDTRRRLRRKRVTKLLPRRPPAPAGVSSAPAPSMCDGVGASSAVNCDTAEDRRRGRIEGMKGIVMSDASLPRGLRIGLPILRRFGVPPDLAAPSPSGTSSSSSSSVPICGRT